MKNFKKNYVKASDLIVDDHIKVAGIMYQIRKLWRVGDTVIIQFHNVRRPSLIGSLDVDKNTLMKIWNQK